MDASRPQAQHLPLARIVLVVALAATAILAASGQSRTTSEPLRIGMVLDYTGRLGVHGPPTELGVRLAVQQINAAGGVFGRPVELDVADGETDPEVAVGAARGLLERGADALIGPMGSAAALAVGHEVSGPFRVPTVTPSATSPELSDADDGGYLFRTALSDVAQGPVLARVAEDDGLEHVAIVYQDDTYGRGLFRSFLDAWRGRASSATVAAEADTYLETLRHVAEGGAEALVVIAYPGASEILVAEALDADLFDRFLFVDANLGPDVVLAVGAEAVEGTKGTRPAVADEDRDATRQVVAEMIDAFGQAPTQGAAFSAYDATIFLCLAAERVDTADGPALRDALHEVCGGRGGHHFDAGAAGVTAALEAARRGREFDFDGASSAIDWNEDGDITRGVVGVYQFADGQPVLLERYPFDGPQRRVVATIER